MKGIGETRVLTRDGVEIALHRVHAGGPSDRPVLLAPGTFSTRQFWLGAKAQGFAYALADIGFDPWVLEHRGHGASERPKIWTIDDWVRHDAPAAVDAVLDATGQPGLVWIGHSAGGVVGAAFAGSGDPLADRIQAMVLFGSPGPGGLTGRRRIGAWLTLLAGAVHPRAHWHGRWLGLGPEHEPGRLVRDWMHWNLSGRWRGADRDDYLAGLARVRAPVLAIAGAGDRMLAPPEAVRDLLNRFGSAERSLIVAGREHGFAEDYDHPGLVIGRGARQEIWPRVLEWLGGQQDSGFGIRDSAVGDGGGSG